MIKNKSHWNNFYKKFKLKKSSNFAKFVFRNGFINKKVKSLKLDVEMAEILFFMKEELGLFL